MPINVNDPEYVSAEKEYYKSSTLEDKLNSLKKMISHAPKHKGGENLRQQLKTRRKKLEQDIVKKKKSGKSSFKGIKKEDMQAIIVGLSNSGKSSLLNSLTNAHPQIADYQFTTKIPTQGMLNIEGTQVQLVENPAVESEYFDKGIINTSDTIVILINKLEEIKIITKQLTNAPGKKIIVFNKIDKLNEKEIRKISSTLKSKKYVFSLISTKTNQGIQELKEILFQSFPIIRVFTKEPGKPKTVRPVILSLSSTVKDAAEKILTGFSKKVTQTKIWGPSSKFPGQIVSLKHKLKDLDTVEFKTK